MLLDVVIHTRINQRTNVRKPHIQIEDIAHATTKKIEFNFKYNGNRVSTAIPADQEGLFITLVKALQDSKEIAGM